MIRRRQRFRLVLESLDYLRGTVDAVILNICRR